MSKARVLIGLACAVILGFSSYTRGTPRDSRPVEELLGGAANHANDVGDKLVNRALKAFMFLLFLLVFLIGDILEKYGNLPKHA